MKLSEHQRLFAHDVAKLIIHINETGYSCTLGEAWRHPMVSEYNARIGTGIANSLHGDRLAIDLNLFSPEGKYLTDPEEYKPFGEWWEKLDPANSNGYRFRDANHFSRTIGDGRR